MSCDEDLGEHPRLRPLEVLPAEADGRRFLVLRDPLGFAAEPVVVSAEAGFILALLDGTRARRDIQHEFNRRYGEILFTDLLDGILRQLDDRLLLDNSRFARERDRRIDEFRSASVREAAHAGPDRAYPGEGTALAPFLAAMFDAAGLRRPAEASPGAASIARPPLCALIAPHIDFVRGGIGYAHAYHALAATPPGRFVVLGVSHAPLAGPFALTRKDFATPLGTVPTDRAFVDRLASRLPFDPFQGEWNHKHEHSVEFQAVMLGWLYAGREVSIVPVLCGYPEAAFGEKRSPREIADLEAFLGALGEAIAADAAPTVLIAGVDLAHVGIQFSDAFPADPAVLATVEREDRALLETVGAGDAEAFFAAIRRDQNARHVCGVPAIYALLRLLPGARGEVLDYRQWADGASTVTFGAVAYPA